MDLFATRMVRALLVCGVLLTLTLTLLWCRQRTRLASRLARIDRLKERMDAHGVRSSRRVKLV